MGNSADTPGGLSRTQIAFLEGYLIDNFYPIKSINRSHSAYGLKQKFSREHFYVTQEQFTAAMKSIGFAAATDERGNVFFNISEESPYFVR